MPRCEKPIVVVAFDFGTTFSGYAFSYVTSPKEVQMNKGWCSGGTFSQYLTYKTPTSVLLDEKGKFASFGYEAEDQFARLAEDNKHQGWRLFRRFKMILHNDKNLSRQSIVEDLQGKAHSAMEIFSMALRYLHSHVIQAVHLQRPSFPETEFQYVITVPAIWDVRAKCFMREAAQMAGLDGNRLEFAHEPEAAALWCCHDALEDGLAGDLLTSDSKYMVIDLGGGTADISVHQVSPEGSIKVIAKPSGGPWGGIYVDEQFLKYLEDRFGIEAVIAMRENNIEDYFDIIREFEYKKRATAYHSTKTFVFKIPSSLNKRISRLFAMPLMLQVVIQLFLPVPIVVLEPEPQGDKIRIESAQAEKWFEKPVSCIIEHVKGIFEHDKTKDVKTILLVGGFGESQYVQDRFRNELPGIKLIVPKDPGLAVLKGAVLFGHNPRKVESRVMTYTYGIAVFDEFDEKKHPIENKILVNGNWYANNVFDIFVKANHKIKVDKEVSHKVLPLGRNSELPVFRTLSENPKYTSDPGCELIGKLSMKSIDNKPLHEQTEIVTFMFGYTELLVKVYHTVSHEEQMLSLECLQ